MPLPIFLFMEQLLIASLAVWRISSLLAREDGPWDIFVRFRLMIGFKYNKSSELEATNGFAKGLECVWCSSLWFAAIAALIMVHTSFYGWLLYMLAISAGAIIVERIAYNG
jgi:hypothetical protein